MAKNLSSADVVIANGGTTSAFLVLPANRIPLAIVTPSAMTGTVLTFNVSFDGATFVPLFYESTVYSITISTSVARQYALNRNAFEGVRFLQIVSGSTEAALRTLRVINGE
jgi:hypothetical protein